MRLSVVIRPEAERDIASTRDWYDRRQDDLGTAFVLEVSAALERIAETPDLYAVRWPDIRSCRTRRFPYIVYYRWLPDRIEVLAVLHGSRRPDAWRSRASE
jgi:plasmid stabilization system protein ParE